MEKNNKIIIIVVITILLIAVLVGGYFLCNSLLTNLKENEVTNNQNNNTNGNPSEPTNNQNNNMIGNPSEPTNNQNNNNNTGKEVTISKSGEVLEFALGRLVVDTTGEVYYMTGDDTNLGSEKIYTTSVYQTGPNSYEFMGYKLNATNIKSLYAMQLGNGGNEYHIFLIDKNGNLSVIKITPQNGKNTVGETIKLTQYKDIVSVVPTSSFAAHSALAIDKNGNLYNIVTSNNEEVKNVTSTRGEVLDFTFGNIIIDATGEVYYEPNTSVNLHGNEATLKNNTRLGSQKEYTTKVYETGPNSFKFSGYKLNYPNIKSAYAAYLGNGADDEYVFLIDKNGNIYMLKFSIENKQYDLVTEKQLTQYKDIVSVVPTGGFGGTHALAIDKNGNMYDLLGE